MPALVMYFFTVAALSSLNFMFEASLPLLSVWAPTSILRALFVYKTSMILSRISFDASVISYFAVSKSMFSTMAFGGEGGGTFFSVDATRVEGAGSTRLSHGSSISISLSFVISVATGWYLNLAPFWWVITLIRFSSLL